MITTSWQPHPHIQASRQQPQEAPLSCGATGSEPRKKKKTSKPVLQFYWDFSVAESGISSFQRGTKNASLHKTEKHKNIIT